MNIAHVKMQHLPMLFQYEVNQSIQLRDQILVKTSQGIEVGEVIKITKQSDESKQLLNIVRLMNAHDVIQFNLQQDLEKEIMKYVKEQAFDLALDMTIIRVHISFDESFILVEFESNQRIDFRELVKRISTTYHARIEMKQIGARDIAKIRGGIGPCGLLLCCSTFIGEFDAISIKMAKNQSLSLNPQNISGLCGKLLCCLKYEDETYQQLKKQMPTLGSVQESEYGLGKVIDVNYISRKAKLKHRDGYVQWVDIQTQG